ncbi:MAG TPA: 6-carboxytetrahydropterin synthase QueD [Longimicrobiales bacterium]|nr:6-carboxytetrahydropterin synthase QueD [Longimicrobiales bacterium]
MYVVSIQSHYDSAHFLRHYRGKCERLHGHRYVVEIALATETVGEDGLAYDFVELKRHLRELTERLDHENLNELPPFTDIEPSAENQARYFYDEVKRRLPEGMRDSLLYARVWETPTQWAQYSERQLFF